MNKIERAIYDTKLRITNLEREILIIETKLKSYKDHLLVLELIESDKSIPHHEIIDHPKTTTYKK